MVQDKLIFSYDRGLMVWVKTANILSLAEDIHNSEYEADWEYGVLIMTYMK